jgi:PIN domain
MAKLFLDANIYLSLYTTNGRAADILLNDLLQVRESVFITRQVRDEVFRNRVQKTREYLERDFTFKDHKQLLAPVYVPTHLSNNLKDRCQEWNSRYSAIENQIKALCADLKLIREGLWKEVGENGDAVTMALQPIFERAVDANGHQMDRASLRKKRGNPPGKKDDPLGDQITWEQLLDEYIRTEEWWIISDDNDFFCDFRPQKPGQRELNPILRDDLTAKGANHGSVHCFNGLQVALEHFIKVSGRKDVEVPAAHDVLTTPSGVAIPGGTGPTGPTGPIGPIAWLTTASGTGPWIRDAFCPICGGKVIENPVGGLWCPNCTFSK